MAGRRIRIQKPSHPVTSSFELPRKPISSRRATDIEQSMPARDEDAGRGFGHNLVDIPGTRADDTRTYADVFFAYKRPRARGEPLPGSILRNMNTRFGADFSDVRVHRNANAANAAESVDARAFTVAKDIVFGSGEYAPESPPGRKLLAHELAHTLQQRTEPPSGRLTVSHPGDPLERQADAAARGALHGGAISPLASAPVHIARVPKGMTVDVASQDAASSTSAANDASTEAVTDRSFSGRELYKIWLRLWSDEQRTASREVRDLEQRLHAADPVGYANKKMMFDQGKRDALGPEYEVASAVLDTAKVMLSDLEAVLAWLEARDVAGQRVTLTEVKAKALRHAEWSALYRRFMEPIILGAPTALGGLRRGASPPARRTLWEREGARSERAASTREEVRPSPENEPSRASAPVRTPYGPTDPPTAVRPDGTRIPPDYSGRVYHGTHLSPEVVLKEGLPARGNDWRLLHHVQENPNSAFRGATLVASDPVVEGGAAYWAGEGGYVYGIEGIPSWDVNKQLGGRVAAPGGFGGNPMHGENEFATPARVPPGNIKRWGLVKRGPSGRLFVEFHEVSEVKRSP